MATIVICEPTIGSGHQENARDRIKGSSGYIPIRLNEQLSVLAFQNQHMDFVVVKGRLKESRKKQPCPGNDDWPDEKRIVCSV